MKVRSMSRPISRPMSRPVSAPLTGYSELDLLREEFRLTPWALYINDPATMYQDSVGTTPVTATSDPVGLWIDQSLGGEGNLGADRWTDPAGTLGEWSHDGSGVYSVTSASSQTLFSSPVLTNESFDLISFDIDSETNGVTVLDGGSIIGNNLPAGSYEYRRTSFGVGRALGFRVSAGESGQVSGISVREIPGHHAFQTTDASRMAWDGTAVVSDGIDDSINIIIPAGGWSGTYLQGTKSGIVEAEFSVPEGAYQIPTNPLYDNEGSTTGLILLNKVASNYEKTQSKLYLKSLGSNVDFSDTIIMANFFRDRSELLSLDLSSWNVSGVTNFNFFVRGCSSLTTLDVSNWDTSEVVYFGGFAYGCSSLTTLDVSNWDTSKVTNFSFFLYGCTSLTDVEVNGGAGSPFIDSPCTNYANALTDTNLTQQSIDDILVAIESAGTSNGTFDQSGGSAPSATGEAAIDALRLRGWTVTVTGGY